MSHSSSDPERHLLDEESVIGLVDPQLHMLSFSTGRRGCPGIILGSTVRTMLLARLVQSFCWGPPLDIDSVDLVESTHDLTLAKPLIARATPRLDPQIYL